MLALLAEEIFVFPHIAFVARRMKVNKFYFIIGLLITSFWNNSVISFCSDVTITIPSPKIAAENFLQAVEMLKKIEEGQYVLIEAKKIVVKKRIMKKDPGHCFDVLDVGGNFISSVIMSDATKIHCISFHASYSDS